VKDQEGVSSRWSIWLWRAFWLVWALRGISLLVDLGAADSLIEVVSWIAFGAVLIELSVRQVRTRNRH
ncbi:MAG: hypothetical protein RLN74_14995, partial [Ilumatobacter fluminis]